jgi:hypothetical protein
MNCLKKQNKLAVFLACFLASLPLLAEISYDQARNRISIVDFSEDLPCGLENVANADRLNAWNRVEYDATTTTWTVNADIYIGDNSGRDTVFRIGSAACLKPLVIMNGDLVVCPDVPAFAPDEKMQYFMKKTTPGVNRLLVGDSENPAVKPIIRFASGKGLVIGKGLPGRFPASGEFYLYNAEITAARPDESGMIGSAALADGSLLLSARSLRMINSKIAWVKNGVSGPKGAWGHLMDGVVFEHCGKGLSWYFDNSALLGPLQNCSFLNCGTALEYPYTSVMLKKCRFEGNSANWVLAKNLKKLILADCDVGKPLKGNVETDAGQVVIENGKR